MIEPISDEIYQPEYDEILSLNKYKQKINIKILRKNTIVKQHSAAITWQSNPCPSWVVWGPVLWIWPNPLKINNATMIKTKKTTTKLYDMTKIWTKIAMHTTKRWVYSTQQGYILLADAVVGNGGTAGCICWGGGGFAVNPAPACACCILNR